MRIVFNGPSERDLPLSKRIKLDAQRSPSPQRESIERTPSVQLLSSDTDSIDTGHSFGEYRPLSWRDAAARFTASFDHPPAHVSAADTLTRLSKSSTPEVDAARATSRTSASRTPRARIKSADSAYAHACNTWKNDPDAMLRALGSRTDSVAMRTERAALLSRAVVAGDIHPTPAHQNALVAEAANFESRATDEQRAAFAALRRHPLGASEAPSPETPATRAKALIATLQARRESDLRTLAPHEIISALAAPNLHPGTKANLGLHSEYAAFSDWIPASRDKKAAIASQCIDNVIETERPLANNARLATNLLVDLGPNFPPERLARFLVAARALEHAQGLSGEERAKLSAAIDATAATRNNS